jgi:hypothetical protein
MKMRLWFMFGRCLLAALGLLIAVNALAQPAALAPKRAVIGKVVKVEGLVTVSDANGITRVALNDPVIDRNRYVTSSSGFVTLRMDKGCDVELRPNQALTVEDERTCEALWALIGSFGGRGSLAPFLAGGAAILLLDGGGGGSNTPGTPGSGGQLPNPPISPQ